ncbi:alpha/beta fold hydrolase [Roseiarcus sp.]|uniref:alpha/beta fold hydrolase n=1 Tax=Roseiarcus sp. TaxID=1969460 RepID=UPI003F979F74
MSVESQMPASWTPIRGVHMGGEGPPLVLLHGIGGTWRVWTPVLPLLEPHCRVVAITLPGHDEGLPVADSTRPSISWLADTVLEQLRSLGLDSAHLAGNSLGGWLALELLRRGFAKSVTALSPAGAWRTSDDFEAMARPVLNSYALARSRWRKAPERLMKFAWFRWALLRRGMEQGQRVEPWEAREMLHALARASVLPKIIAAVHDDGPIAPIPASAAPVTIAWGARDRLIPFHRYGVPMLALVSCARPLMLAGVGHMPMYDDSGRVAKTILETVASAENGLPPGAPERGNAQ